MRKKRQKRGTICISSSGGDSDAWACIDSSTECIPPTPSQHLSIPKCSRDWSIEGQMSPPSQPNHFIGSNRAFWGGHQQWGINRSTD
ncbi:hypothetical protein FHG87_003680 [Trinorchestia longiramus]|nr:hypothetical protein FHG87_003680 [Trinorchestia longiramus]